MRPPTQYRLNLKIEPKPQGHEERFKEALRDLIEAIVRSEIKKLRGQHAPQPTPSRTADGKADC